MRRQQKRATPERMFSTGHDDDDARLEALADADQLATPLSWAHFLHAAHEETARALADLLASHWQTQVQPSPHGEGYVVQARRDGVILTAAEVSQARADLTSLAQSLGAHYDTWMAWS